ncbi:MAG: EF-hand domain-containing protein [Propionivibrio sp.]
MSTLTGISNYSSAASYLFSKIDTSNKGYIEKEDLVSAFSSLTSASDTSASDVFSQLDSDSDGKVTESEFSSALEALNGQYNQSRMQGAMPPPPPPPADDAGFTEDELTSQLEEIGDTDSARSTLIGSILENFDAADTDGDGKVSRTEAMAYAESNDIATSTSGDKTAASESKAGSASVSEAQVYQQIMELMRAYGSQSTEQNLFSSLTSAISTRA